MEWPPRSGKRASFPEVDKLAWWGRADAKRKILPGQVELLVRLETLLLQSGRNSVF
jgi:predicted NUDIX family NTP pyrophosphohydrolase